MARKKKEEKNNNIDLGSWTCPVRWSDITLKQFQDIQRYYADKEKKVDVRDIVHILCGKTRDEVNLLPTEFLEKILEKLSFLSEEPAHQEPQSSIVIKGEKFVINIMEKLKAVNILILIHLSNRINIIMQHCSQFYVERKGKFIMMTS